jgi:hypothetical protein
MSNRAPVFVSQFQRMKLTDNVIKAKVFIEIEKQQRRALKAASGPKKGVPDK